MAQRTGADSQAGLQIKSSHNSAGGLLHNGHIGFVRNCPGHCVPGIQSPFPEKEVSKVEKISVLIALLLMGSYSVPI